MSQVVTLQLDTADCLGIGQSLRALVASGRIPACTAEAYLRVADQMVSAAKAEILNGATTEAAVSL